MDEFDLAKASLTLSGLQITFRRQGKPAAPVAADALDESYDEVIDAAPTAIQESPKGHPVSSPMAGIFYLSSSPSSPAFVKLGEPVSAGQVIGLIEAMKVFNEIPSPVAGTVLEILVESASLVQPGQVLLRIG
jgi:acetyl-CoA carboxylase biotin carboxyl carrier protein